MFFVGIDIGSTASKVAVRGQKELEFVLPTGWNSKETAFQIQKKLFDEYKIDVNSDEVKTISTGYGRVCVPYAGETVTEITCHAKGVQVMYDIKYCTIIDVGGQDTKIISIKDGKVDDFMMNDKCSAGTGKFLEIMCNRLGLTIDELFTYANNGKVLQISSMCTVFAESEIIGLMGDGNSREDIAAGVVDSVSTKVKQLATSHGLRDKIILTGGLSVNPIFVRILSEHLGQSIIANKKGRFAGAIGAAAIAQKKFS
jgi:predicted CoA-substrate-specific enzyme activase